MDLSQQYLSPPHSPPAYSVPSPPTRGPDAGSGGEVGDGGARLAWAESRQPRLRYSVLDTGPGEEAPTRDRRPLVRSMSTVLGPKVVCHRVSREPRFRRRFGLNRISPSFAEDAQLHLCVHLPGDRPCPMFIVADDSSACSQGGVQFPTGGKGGDAKPASAFGPTVLGVSRSGVIPEPTV